MASFDSILKTIRKDVKALTGKPFSAQSFANYLGVNAEKYRKWEQGSFPRDEEDRVVFRNVFQIDNLENIPVDSVKAVVKRISDHINSGRRDPTVSDDTSKPYHLRRFESIVHDIPDVKPTGEEIRMQKAIGETEDPGLIYVPIAAQAGYTKNFQDAVYMDQLERVYIPNSPYRGDEFRYFEVEGDSMYPTLEDGIWVVAQRVPQESWNGIFNFYIYVIVTLDQIMVKRLYKNNNQSFILISDNEEMYPQFKLEIAKIKELWLVKRKMDWNMAAPKEFKIKIS